ncbi:hypothetical protein RhiirA5_445036, partial [Rhizophagus irregularis]
FSRVLNIAKLQADITYKWRKQESIALKSAIDNIELEQHTNLLDNIDEQNNNINNDDFDLDNIDVEDIEHPAQNKDAKWKLDIIFEDNLHCPFLKKNNNNNYRSGTYDHNILYF